MYIAMKYIQPMSRQTLWPWKGNVLLKKKKIPSQVLSSLPFKKTLLLSQQQNQLSSAILTASYCISILKNFTSTWILSNVTPLSQSKKKFKKQNTQLHFCLI